MKIIMCILISILLVVMGVFIGLVIDSQNVVVKFVPIDMKVIRTAFLRHGIKECGLDIDGNLFFYRGQVTIPNPDRLRGCFVLNNELRNFFAEECVE